jgi:membrane AbrB-like protein
LAPQSISKKSVALLAASIIVGGLFESIGMPLGWLFGAAVVTGAVAMSGHAVEVPKLPHRAAMVLIGASVGLAMTPDVASEMARWGLFMIFAAVLGVAAACAFAPLLSRFGRLDPATAYFCLLPGGVIEMARIGEGHNADPTVIAAIHAVRVALVVGLVPLGLLIFYPQVEGGLAAAAMAGPIDLAVAFAVGVAGGWAGHRFGLPAPWLLGAVLASGAVAATGAIGGGVQPALLAAAQVIVGVALGARFNRDRILSVPRALAVGAPTMLAIIGIMAMVAAICATVMGESVPTLILALSIGGMAEMVLTAKLLGQDIVLVAAFQTVRAIIVNSTAGMVWTVMARYLAGSR